MVAMDEVPAPVHADWPGVGYAAGGTLGRFAGDRWVIVGGNDQGRRGERFRAT